MAPTDLNSSDEDEEEQGNATPDYGAPQQDEDATQGEDDALTEPGASQEETELGASQEEEADEDDDDDDDDDDPLRPPGAAPVPEERTQMIVNVSMQMSEEFENTMNSWAPSKDGLSWIEADVADVYRLRRALKPTGPLPAAKEATLRELQPLPFTDSGFLSKYLQTNVEEGAVLLANLFGFERHDDALLKRYIDAAKEAEQRQQQAGPSRASGKTPQLQRRKMNWGRTKGGSRHVSQPAARRNDSDSEDSAEQVD